MGLTRGIGAALLAEMAKPVWYPVVFVWLDWPEAPVRVHSAGGVITWDGEDWAGVGHFGGLVVPGEGLSLVPGEAELVLSGVDDAIYGYLDDPIRNRNGAVYLGALAARPGQAGGDALAAGVVPVELFGGYMDAMALPEEAAEEDGRTIITRSVRLMLGTGPGARTSGRVVHSYEGQASEYPGDTAGRHLADIRNRTENMTWPEN